MSRAHAYARAHRSEFESYKEALREAKQAREEPGTKSCSSEAISQRNFAQISEATIKHELFTAYDTPETRAAAIIREGVRKYRERVPLLLKDWKAEDYNGRRDFRAWMR
jgi:hypothetical protein